MSLGEVDAAHFLVNLTVRVDSRAVAFASISRLRSRLELAFIIFRVGEGQRLILLLRFFALLTN